MSVSPTSPPSPKPSIHGWIENDKYDNAETIISNLSTQDLYKLFEKVNDLNFFQLLLKKNLADGTKAQKFFNQTIQILKNQKDKELIAKFQEIHFFNYSLKHGPETNFNSLLNKHSELLKNDEISKCLKFIVKNDLIDQCETLINKLTEENIQLIIEGPSSPLIQSIKNNCPKIFKIFLSHIHKAVSCNRGILFALKNKKIDILHEIAKQKEHGEDFLQIFWNQSLPKISFEDKKVNEDSFAREIVDYIDSKDSNETTPLSEATKLGHQAIVEKLLQFGADPFISSNGKKPIDLTSSNEIKELLEMAEYGCIKEIENSPLKLKQILNERKKQGLINSCKNGKLKIAEKLIQDFKVDSTLVDDKDNSLIMILLNQNAPSQEISNFIEFLGKDRINAKQVNEVRDTALTLAASKNDTKVSVHLINNFSDQFEFNHKNNKGLTVSKIAESFNNIEILAALFQNSHNFSDTEKQGTTPFSFIFSSLKQFQERFLKIEADSKEKNKFNEKKLKEMEDLYQKSLNDQKLELSEIQKKFNQEQAKVKSLSQNLENLKSLQEKYPELQTKFEEYKIQSEKEQKSQFTFFSKELEFLKKTHTDRTSSEQQNSFEFSKNLESIKKILKLQEEIKKEKHELKENEKEYNSIKEQIEKKIQNLEKEKEPFQSNFERAKKELNDPGLKSKELGARLSAILKFNECTSKLDEVNEKLEKEKYLLEHSRKNLKKKETKIIDLKSMLSTYEKELKLLENEIKIGKEETSQTKMQNFDPIAAILEKSKKESITLPSTLEAAYKNRLQSGKNAPSGAELVILKNLKEAPQYKNLIEPILVKYSLFKEIQQINQDVLKTNIETSNRKQSRKLNKRKINESKNNIVNLEKSMENAKASFERDENTLKSCSSSFMVRPSVENRIKQRKTLFEESEKKLQEEKSQLEINQKAFAEDEKSLHHSEQKLKELQEKLKIAENSFQEN